MSSENDWVREEFPEDALLRSGLMEVSDLPITDKLGLISVLGALNLYRPGMRGLKLDFYVVSSTEPVAKVLVSKRYQLAAFVGSIGLVRLLSALCARVALSAESSKMLTDALCPIRGKYSIKPFPVEEPRYFGLSPAKRRWSGLTEGENVGVIKRLSDESSLLYTELFSAALEFLVLHEASHVILRHREASELFRFTQTMTSEFDKLGLLDWQGKDARERFRPEIRLARCFEHQADYLALQLICQMVPRRPCLAGTPLSGSWVGSVCTNRRSRRHLGVLGAAVALALVALLQAPEPKKELDLTLRGAGSHPAAALRLTVASSLLVESLKSPLRRLLVWPTLRFRSAASQIGLLSWSINIAAMASISSEWEGMLNRPGKDWPTFLQKLFLEEKTGASEELSMLQSDFVRANELVRAVRKTWSSK